MNAAHLRELIGMGIAGETLVRVAEIIDEEVSVSMDKSADIRRGPLESTAEINRKERDKQRKRLTRATQKLTELSAPPSTDVSTDVSTDCAENPCDLSSLKEDSSQKEVKEKKESKRGSRLLKDTRVSDENRAFAETLIPPENVESEWAEFVDYWIGVPGSRGLKLNWPATWRNRVREIAKKYRGRNIAKPLTEFQRKQVETNDVRSQLKNLANGGGSSGTADRLLSHDHGERPEGLRSGPGAIVLAIPGASGRGGG